MTNPPMPRRKARAVMFVALALALVGCSKTPAATEGPRTELTTESRAQIDRVLGAYEAIRAKLASDQTAAIATDAQRLAQTARDAAGSAPPSLRPLLESLSTAAASLQGTTPDDADAVRKAFGVVSQATIALLGADSSLTEGRYIYDCPMTEGYGKWLQTTETVSNPYMGSRMLECGAEVAWDARP